MDKSIVILTGAGISAESGLQTFRASDGLWCGHKVEEVATPEGFARNPALVHEFYNQRRRQLREVEPNAAHLAIAELAARWQGDLLLVTQNVDDLHDRAFSMKNSPHPNPLPKGEGSARYSRAHTEKPSPWGEGAPQGAGEGYILHMHGELSKARHIETHEVIDWRGDMDVNDPWRPHIVWFGEMPLEMKRIERALSECDLFVSIGTSGNVYPAAGFVAQARHYGAHTIEMNLEPSQGASLFAEKRYGKATELVPAWVRELL